MKKELSKLKHIILVLAITFTQIAILSSCSNSDAITSSKESTPASLKSETSIKGIDNNPVQSDSDANEISNVFTNSPVPGRGANMAFDMYEAEDGTVGGGAFIVGPNRIIGDLAGEASGRKAVTLNSTGSFVEFKTKASTNTLVTRFSIPDAADGNGTTATLNVYVNGVFSQAITLNSIYAWLYGPETMPDNSPSSNSPRHIYDEANIMFDSSIPAGSTIKLQKDAENTSTYAIDFINLEQVAPIVNPDSEKYVVPAGFTQQDVQAAIDKAIHDTSKLGVYLPAGNYPTTDKFKVYDRAIKIIGAGPWYTRFNAPLGGTYADIGFTILVNGCTAANFSYFGNYTFRIDGPGKVFDLYGISGTTIDNIWAEHQICLYWGTNTDNTVIKNCRIRNLYADGVNMTNGSCDNLVSNCEARATGDDSFALFSAIDAGGTDEMNNVYENLTSICTWRAAGIAVYGGYGNTFRNIYVADTLCYSGITISSLDFGYQMNGFGATPTTNLQNISLVRCGGHFWGEQTFPAIWVFSASKKVQGIRVSDVDITDPTYCGIMFQTNYSLGSAQNPVTDTIFTNITISDAKKSGDAYDAKSGLGLWANESSEADQGPAVGSAIFKNLTFKDVVTPIKNITKTFTFDINP